MHTETFLEPEANADAKLRLFSLYVDFAASVRARWASGIITKLVGPRWKTSTEMWALDFSQTSQPIREMMFEGAADADMLIVALSSLDQREPKLIEWLNALAGQKAERPVPGLFIGLLGDEDHEAGELEWTVKQFMRCAQRTGRDFIWHWMGQEAINDTTWLTDNVEKFLSRKQYNMAWVQETAADDGQVPEAVWLVADTG
jgi:hypothetical protein